MINNKTKKSFFFTLLLAACEGANMFTRLGFALKGHEAKMHGGSLPSALLDTS